MTADVDALRTLAEAATSGPWVLDSGGEQIWDGAQSEGIAHVSWERGLYGEGDSNLAFIAAANPTAVLALLDELAAARAAVERWEATIHDYENRALAAEATVRRVRGQLHHIRAVLRDEPAQEVPC